MSVKVIHEEINRFLKSSDPEVLCIKGRWGVGKTFAWTRFIHEAIEISVLRDYSYVSLFGLNSLEDLRYSIFENTVPLEDLRKSNSSNFKQKLAFFNNNRKKALAYISRNPIIQSKIGGSEKLLFLGVRNQIVCIDDLERSGEGLRLLDVLGLASALKEERGCKVVLLLNEEELTQSDKIVFDKQLEKVTDTVMVFSPTPEESAKLVFDTNSTELSRLLKENCTALGITNIRIIKKIEKHALVLSEILKDYPLLQEQVAHTVTLFGWSLYGALGAPTLKFLQDFNNTYAILGRDEYSPEEKKWAETMKDYRFTFFDDFDSAVLENMVNGYFDEDQMISEAKKKKNQSEKTEMENRFSEVWDQYHDSFDTNDEQLLDSIYRVAIDCCEVISPMNLNSTVTFLKDFGKINEAETLISTYIESRSEEKDIFNLSENPFREDVNDPTLVSAFAEKHESFDDNRDPKEVLIGMSKNRGWNQEDARLLAKLSEGDFYRLFKNNPGEDLRKIVYGALMFRGNHVGDEDKTTVIENVTDALKRIAGESEMNRRRVQKYGISLDD